MVGGSVHYHSLFRLLGAANDPFLANFRVADKPLIEEHALEVLAGMPRVGL